MKPEYYIIEMIDMINEASLLLQVKSPNLDKDPLKAL